MAENPGYPSGASATRETMKQPKTGIRFYLFDRKSGSGVTNDAIKSNLNGKNILVA
uniref:hypothetical protein n=1 Tax=Enterococcus mundtii TaxID=53346 RepID=UPI0035C73376